MGPPSYMQSVIDQNVVMQCMTELLSEMQAQKVHIFFLNKFMK